MRKNKGQHVLPTLSKVGLAFLLAFTGLLSGIGGSPIGQAGAGSQDLRPSIATSGDVERSGNSSPPIAKELDRFRTSDTDDGDGDLPDVVSDIELDPDHFSPNGDGVHDTTDITFKVNSPTQYFSLDVYDPESLDWKGTIIETFDGMTPGNYIVRGWDGTVMYLHREHLLSEGVYFVIPWHGDMSISPIVSQQSPFVIDVTAPVSNLDDPPITVQGETGTISGQIVSDLMIDIYGDYQGIRVYASYDDNGSKSVDGEIAEDGSFQIEVPVKRGENAFNVYVEDSAGNGSLEPAYIVEYAHVVQEPPAVPSAVDTPASQYAGAQVTLSWSKPDDWGSGETRSYDVQLYDGDDWDDLVTDHHDTSWTGNLPEDANTRKAQIRVRAITEHGASDYVQSDVFRIGAPGRPTVKTYSEVTNTATVMIEGTAEEGATVEISRGDDTFTGTADDQTGAFQIEVPLLENQHNALTIKAIADNLIGKPIEIGIVHDNIAPSDPTITIVPSGWTNAEAVNVTITAGEDDLSGVERTEYLIEAEGEQQALSLHGTWQKYTDSIDITAEGITTVYARTWDQAGNSSSVVEAAVQVDRTAPQLTLIGDNPMSIPIGSEYVELGATAEDNVDDDISEQIEITGEVDTSTVGSYDVTYSVTDRAGNEASVTRTVTVEDTEGPTDVKLTVIDRTTDSITLGLSAYDPSGIKEYILHRDGQQIAVIDGSATTYTDTGLESGQAYTYTVVAVDPFGNTSEPASLTVTTEEAVKSRPDDEEQDDDERDNDKQDDDEKHPPIESDGKQERGSSKLPKTASLAYTWLLFGTVLLALATALIVYRRKRIN